MTRTDVSSHSRASDWSSVHAVVAGVGVAGFAAADQLLHLGAHVTVIDGADGPLSPGVIAERLIVTAATMTSVVDTLERRGMVERTIDKADRRRQLVSITPAGREAVDAFLPQIVTLQTELMRSFTEDERAQLTSYLDRMREALTELGERADDVAEQAAPRRRKD